MDTKVQPPRCTVYDWCSYATHERGHHLTNINLIELLDEPNRVIEVNLYADDDTPAVMRLMFPGADGVTAYIDMLGAHAGAIAAIIRMFEGPGLFDRRGLRELAELLAEGAETLSEVTEL